MVMISFKMDKQLQTISNYFLFSLAVADLIIGLISMPLNTVYMIQGVTKNSVLTVKENCHKMSHFAYRNGD